MTRRQLIVLGAMTPWITIAQQGGNRKSPHETVSVDLNGKKIAISYGRPFLKGRHLGDPMAPYGKVWRLGADEATKITVDARTQIADTLEMAPGSYSLFAILEPDKWTMIVNKTADQWGAFSYDQSKDLGRFDLKVKKLSTPVEEFTITLSKEASNIALLRLAWDTASVSTTLKVL